MTNDSKLKNIQLFRPVYNIEEVLNEIRKTLEIGWTGLGFKTVEFEKLWQEYTGFKNAHFLNSATSGLHLAIAILKNELGWKTGDEIITTPLTFVSTNHAILYEGLSPVFADIDEYLCIDPNSVKKLITPKTRGIIFVGIGGSSGHYEEIVNIAKENKISLILDAAHMAGTRVYGDIVGKECDAVVYSFQAVKNLPTADSGMICFSEKKHDEIVRKMTWLGINKDTFTRTIGDSAYKWKYDVEYTGFKYHGNSIMAAIGIIQLKYLDRDNAYRRQIASWYDAVFHHSKIVKTVPVPGNCESSRHLYQIEVSNRDELLLALNRVGVYPGVHYRINTHYDMYKKAKGKCPVAERKSKRILSLPIHLGLSYKDVEYVSENVLKYSTP
jgi:dTDP-4-amino-4,6-dideoxygalactose transaminase